MREDIGPGQWAGQPAVVALPERMDASSAGQIREELLSVINGGRNGAGRGHDRDDLV